MQSNTIRTSFSEIAASKSFFLRGVSIPCKVFATWLSAGLCGLKYVYVRLEVVHAALSFCAGHPGSRGECSCYGSLLRSSVDEFARSA